MKIGLQIQFKRKSLGVNIERCLILHLLARMKAADARKANAVCTTKVGARSKASSAPQG